MKRLLAFFIISALLFALSACGSDAPSAPLVDVGASPALSGADSIGSDAAAFNAENGKTPAARVDDTAAAIYNGTEGITLYGAAAYTNTGDCPIIIESADFTFTAGKVMIRSILSKVFGREVPVRMRAGFFPFVEPGFEIDMGCLVCGGKGCSVCKHVGWIEIMPGGTPHPNVLRAAGLDPDEFTGFYVNIGLDRLVMMRYGVDDVRLFHSADLRFLGQFH